MPTLALRLEAAAAQTQLHWSPARASAPSDSACVAPDLTGRLR